MGRRMGVIRSQTRREKPPEDEFSPFGKAHTIATFQGRSELYIENFKKLQYFSCNEICVQTGSYRMRIQGKQLKICFFTPDEMKITGQMESVCFC